MMMKPTTMTSTSPTEPLTISSLRRCSAFLAAACWAAIRSLALRALFRVALLIYRSASISVLVTAVLARRPSTRRAR